MTVADLEGRDARPLEADLSLLATKLAGPRVPTLYVRRPRVDALLDQGTGGPLTVVTAGPGWGKTLATAAWAASGPAVGPVAWVSLDEGDDDPRTFWSYFVAAVRGTIAVPQWNPLAHIVPGPRDEESFHRRLLAGLTQLDSPVAVVLDDFHTIREPAILSRVAELLRHRVDQLRLVLLTRSDPTLPLHRLRLDGHVAEVRARDLGLDAADAAVLLEKHDLQVSAEETQLLVDRTEGWPAGMRLASLFLARHESPRQAADFAGNDELVSGYLAQEVLASQPPDVRRFMLRTSVLARLNSELAQVVTGEVRSQQYLETLESSNAFVVGLGPGREWFRYHALLREMLRHRLAVEDPQALPELHRRAAEWFAAKGYAIHALNHAADAGDWALLGRLLVTQAFPLGVSVERLALLQVLDRIPADRLDDGPELNLAAAGRLFLSGRFQDMHPYLDGAAARVHDAHPEVRNGVRLMGLMLSGAASRAAGDISDLIRAESQAIDLVSSSGFSLPAGETARAIALGNLALGQLWAGRPTAAVSPLEEALAALEAPLFELAKVNLLSHLGFVCTQTGRLRSGVEHASRAIQLVESRGWGAPFQVALAYLTLALANHDRNDVAEARLLLAKGREASRPERAPRVALELAQVRLDASQGRVDPARALLLRLSKEVEGWPLPGFLARWWSITEAEVELAAGNPALAAAKIASDRDREPPFVTERVCLARALLAGGDPHAAEQVLAPVRATLGAEPFQEIDEVELWLLTALAADSLREDDRATVALARAVAVAGPAEIRRPFVRLDGDRLRRLLNRSKDVDPGLAGVVDDLSSYLSAPAGDLSPVDLTAPLTDRELMILRFLPTMMTNTEIAAELYLSVNTVKAHLKRIFRKLDVDTRRQAAHRARELGLLGDSVGTAEPWPDDAGS